uniref:LMBR1 domain containing 2a n=1 Tax=Cynoglossus semilaevis TaxID=244447 RepID=A0A3P8VUL9_CYNSE
MTAAVLAVVIIVLFFLALCLIHRYGDLWKQQQMVLFGTLLSWYLCFLIVFVLPLDVSMVYTGIFFFTSVNTSNTEASSSTYLVTKVCQQPWSHISDVLLIFWTVVYISRQFVLYPVYCMLHFHKCFCSLAFSLICRLLLGCCCPSCSLMLDLELSAELGRLKQLSAANTWGLFLLVLLLGYGLVEIPRLYWLSSSLGHLQAKTYFKVAKMAVEKEVAAVNDSVKYNHSLRKCVNTILTKAKTSSDPPTQRDLIGLHKKVISAEQRQSQTQVQWVILLEQTFHLEDVAKSQNSPVLHFNHSFPSTRSHNWIHQFIYTPSVGELTHYIPIHSPLFCHCR